MSEPESNPSPPAAPIKELSGRIGKYDIVRPLGKGAMGMVYLAHDTMLERDVALKVMVSQIADDPELNQRFIREAKAVAKMTHPNVVNVFDLGHHTDGSPYIAMELLKGQDLQKAMRTPPPMPLDKKVSTIVQVLAGLAHAHQAGIVHRDIKPANIFLNNDGTVKIMDFGVARLTTASMTGTGNIVGTADYMSPEQVKGAKVDGRSDLFSVGCMLYELLAGRRPFHSDNLMAIFYKITHEEPNFDLIPEGPEYDDLMPLLKKALAKNLEERYQTAYDFALALREYLKAHATGSGAESALEGLLDIEAPVSIPEPIGEEGATLIQPDEGPPPVGATMNLGPTVMQPRTADRGGKSMAPTVLGGAPTAAARERPGTAAGRTKVLPPPAAAPAAARPAPARAVPRPMPAPEPRGYGLHIALGAMALAIAGLAAYVVLNKPPTAQPQPPVTQAVAPPTTVAAPTTMAAATPPPSAAPPPTFGEAVGRAAATLRAAQAAFRAGDYDRAMAQAQKALSEDPGNADAKRIVDNALNGQKAQARFRNAEAALKQGDFEKAMAEVDAGRSHAPWDARAPQLISRINEAQQQAQAQAQQQRQAQLASQVNSLLGQADAALSGQKYDAAIGLYDEVLKVDPANQRANMGKTSAVGARALSQAAAAGGAAGGGTRPGGSGRSFQTSKTVAQSAETRAGGSVPEGFEDTPGVAVKKATQAADLPGKIHFDIDPDVVRPGERYTVKVYMVNEGSAPIQIRDMIVNTKINGKGISGPVPPQAKNVAPQQRTLIMTNTELWKEDTSSWSMEVTVRTVRGERYSNQVTWK